MLEKRNLINLQVRHKIFGKLKAISISQKVQTILLWLFSLYTSEKKIAAHNNHATSNMNHSF